VILIFILGLTCTGCAPTLAGKLTTSDGVITNHHQGRINIVSLDDPEKASWVVAVSKTGTFELSREFKKGRYLVEVLVPGYAISSQEVIIDGDLDMAIQLRQVTKGKRTAINASGEIDSSRGIGGASLMPPQM
jgi:hypothetical protein